MQRYFLEVMYNGLAFHGSQMQGDLPTVQLTINKAISTLLRTPIETFGASRTDEGVHALCSFYHFDTELELHSHFQYKMNAILPGSISVTAMYKCIGEPMNARFDAIARSYRYKIYHQKNPFYLNRALYYPFKFNRDILNETAAVLKDYRNFESFSKRNTQTHTFLCTIHESYWEEHEDQLHYVVVANRFLRGMVRGLVGTQLKIASKGGTVKDFISIIEAQDCTKANFSVPGHGLYLEKITYPEGRLEEIFLR